MRTIKMMLVAVLVIPCAVLLAACGGPNIPAWVNDAPATTMEEMKTYYEGQGFTVAEIDGALVGTKTGEDGKFYNVIVQKGTKVVLEAAFDASKKIYNETGTMSGMFGEETDMPEDVQMSLNFSDDYRMSGTMSSVSQDISMEVYMVIKGDWMIVGQYSDKDFSKM